MEGLHLTLDIFECQCASTLLTDAIVLEDNFLPLIHAAGLTIVASQFHTFKCESDQAAGITATVMLAESHVAIHTWPEYQALTLDVYVCNFLQNNSTKARQLAQAFIDLFQGKRVVRNEIQRGQPHTQLLFEPLTSDSLWATRTSQFIDESVSQFQRIEVAESSEFGKILRLDASMMTSERDEFFYHECMVHPAAIAHPNPKKALVIGGGDGGSSEELLKHNSIEQITICEIDPEVVAMAKKHFTSIHKNVFDDAKVNLVHEEGNVFMNASEDRFDLILLDLTDPVSSLGTSLATSCLSEDFFVAAASKLNSQGALVMHLGSPIFHQDRVIATLDGLRQHFTNVDVITVYIPLYGTLWAMAIASHDLCPHLISKETVNRRLFDRGVCELNYYNSDIHFALFALPNFMKNW